MIHSQSQRTDAETCGRTRDRWQFSWTVDRHRGPIAATETVCRCPMAGPETDGRNRDRWPLAGLVTDDRGPTDLGLPPTMVFTCASA